MKNFAKKHPNFGIPNLMRYVAIANIVFWLLGSVKPEILNYLAFNPELILRGQIWRLVSYSFIPPGTGILTFVAVYFYYFIGNTLERYWGTAMFNMYFFMGIILTCLYGFLVYFVFGYNFALNAEYIYLSMFFSFAVLFPDMTVLLFFIIPIKIKWLAIVDAVFFLMQVISYRFPVNLLPVVAILNFLIFCGSDIFRFKMPWKGKPRVKKEPVIIKFHPDKNENFTYKCAVCGRTDVSNPELEFRYCSKCAGSHCFCMDHIFNHIHFTE